MKKYKLMFNDIYCGVFGQCVAKNCMKDYHTEEYFLSIYCGYIYKVYTENGNFADIVVCVARDKYAFYSVLNHSFLPLNNECFDNYSFELLDACSELIEDWDITTTMNYSMYDGCRDFYVESIDSNIETDSEDTNCEFEDIKAQMKEFGMTTDDVCNCIENKAYYNDIVEICHGRGVDVNDLEDILNDYFAIKKIITKE